MAETTISTPSLDEIDSTCMDIVSHIKFFNRSYMTLLISIGFIGNFLTILVFMATKLRHVPSSHYLSALAAADAGMLTCSFVMLLGTSKYPYLLIGSCPILIYSNNVFSSISVWCVVGFTLERFVAVRFPLARLRWCTVNRTRRQILAIACLALIFNLYVFIYTRIQIKLIPTMENDTVVLINQTFCDAVPEYYQFHLSMNYVDSGLTLIIPLILIVGFNASIACKLLHQRTNRDEIFVLSEPTLVKSEHPDRKSQSVCSPPIGSIDLRRHGGGTKRVDERVTRLLFIISTTFIIMNMPDHINRMIASALYESGRWETMSASGICRYTLGQQVTSTIFYSYFAVNFIMYNVAGVNFRRELKTLIVKMITCGIWKKHTTDTSNGKSHQRETSSKSTRPRSIS